MDDCAVVPEALRISVVQGPGPVLAWKSQLMELCRRTDQAGAMDHLEYYLARPAFARKRPTLVLGTTTDNQLTTAVLLYEHILCGIGSGVYTPDFLGAARTVIAPGCIRGRAAFTACATLQGAGARLVHVSYESADTPEETYGVTSLTDGRLAWVAIPRPVSSFFPLWPTYDATLATLGQHTRRNLRYYRRRAESELGARYVPQIKISREEFLEANRHSLNPVDEETAADRIDGIRRLQRPLLAGVYDANGRWLSFIGGRRHEDTAEILWQVNRAGLERYSISTVMRSFLLEHEVSLGTSRLEFEGGTLHTMKHYMVNSSVVDLVVSRDGLQMWAIRKFARHVFPESLLRDLLLNPSLAWKSW